MPKGIPKNGINRGWFKRGHTINKGHKFGEEHGRKISEARKGMKFTEGHIKNMSKALKGRISPRKGYKMTPEELKKHKLINLGRKASEETKRKMSESQKKLNTPEHRKKLSEVHKGHKSYLPKGYKHSDEVKKKISDAGRLNWTREEFRKKCSGKNQFEKSYMEKKLFELVKLLYPEAVDDFVIKDTKWVRFPDIFIKKELIIVEYDGKKWHKLSKDKKRDKEIIGKGYKILHYQGYIPLAKELINDIESLKNSEMNYKYKRDGIDITYDIEKIESYKELNN